MRTVVCGLLAFVAVAVNASALRFTAKSAKSDLFAGLRKSQSFVVYNECDKEVTASLGTLEQSYNQFESANRSSDRCTWRLHAPSNHVVNVISVSFVLEDEFKPEEGRNDDVRTSTISLYDGSEPEEDKLLTRYFVTPREKVGYFVQSLSSGTSMAVEIKYHDNKDYATQKVLVSYEFVDADEARALLKTLR